MDAEIRAKVRDFIVNNFYVTEPSVITGSASLRDRGIVDSTGMLEVVSFLEQEFGLEVADHELVADNFDTLDAIIAYVARKRN
ncbi:MAG TPA: acyl carrier protein [Polyangiaceae bacterium]|nr:acyl carrier protein [Polyangiaceae bacterium]